MSFKIKTIKAREILDSRGWPTIEVKVELSNGLTAKASSPAGTISSQYEAKDLVDGDHRRYHGKGVLLAVNHINELIAPRLVKKNINEQKEIDQIMIDMDGTDNKRQLGSNAILAVSLACARAGALSEKKELFDYLQAIFALKKEKNKLPTPLFNIFNGGAHADTNLDFQEFLINPNINSSRFAPKVHENRMNQVIRAGSEIYHVLGQILKESGYDSDVGLEGGYAPDLDSSIKAIELMLAAIKRAGYRVEDDFNLGLDIGSSVLFDDVNDQYLFALDGGHISGSSLIDLYHDWLSNYPINYLEDGLSENQWDKWKKLTKELGDKLVIAGDDLFTTSQSRLREGIKHQAANAVVIKPNQAGSLTEVIDFAKLAIKHKYSLIVSHRSGETNDDFITDLAVALGADYLKAGSLSRGERLAKYNRLLEISYLSN
jgi:enolase